jgi:hypothetical protein
MIIIAVGLQRNITEQAQTTVVLAYCGESFIPSRLSVVFPLLACYGMSIPTTTAGRIPMIIMPPRSARTTDDVSAGSAIHFPENP